MKTVLQPIAILIATAVTVAAGAAEPDAACAPVLKAMAKTLASDHATVTHSGGRSFSGITADGVNYLQIDGAWKASPMSPKDNQARSDENLRNAKSYVCGSLPDSTIDGVPVANYRARAETEDGVSEAQIAISKSSGLVIQADNKFGADTKSQYSTRYMYSGIHAPSVQK